MKINQTTKHSVKISVFFGGLVLLILLSLTSLWLSRTIFNTNRFTAITTTAFSEPSSRESVGNLVASRIFENAPLLRAALSDRLAGYISGLLASETANSGVEGLAREVQLLFTSPRQDPVTLDLSTLKPIIASAQELIIKDESKQRVQVTDIPDTITIIDTTALPNFHKYAVYVHLAGPASALTAAILAFYWLKKGGRNNRYKRLRILLITAGASAAVAILIGPLAEPSFISLARDAPSQTLIGNLYRAFITPFRNQALILAGLSIAGLLIITSYHEVHKRFKINLRMQKR